MKLANHLFVLLVAGAALAPAAVARAQVAEAQTITAATDVFNGFTAFRTQSIPQSMLADAQAVAIIPNVVKGGFVIAGRFGRGVLIVRDQTGPWRAPSFVTFTGGSVGWQVGLQSTDVVLVFKNRKGVEAMLNGSEFTLGADASIAAGPVGRQATAGTDGKLNAEIYSYSRSRGLFAGVALDGSVLKVDQAANAAYYVGGAVPQPAADLVALVARDTVAVAPTALEVQNAAVVGAAAAPTLVQPGSTPAPATAPSPLAPTAQPQPFGTTQPAQPNMQLPPLVLPQQGQVPPQPPTLGHLVPIVSPSSSSPTQLRQSLVDASHHLQPLVDESWRKYLELPPQVYGGPQPPSTAELTASLEHYNRVQQDPAYQALADRPEFRAAHDLLQRYAAATEAVAKDAAAGFVPLPPPPAETAAAPAAPRPQ